MPRNLKYFKLRRMAGREIRNLVIIVLVIVIVEIKAIKTRGVSQATAGHGILVRVTFSRRAAAGCRRVRKVEYDARKS